MRALIIADRSLASRERAMLARLEVGLADEGVRVIHAVPQVIGSGIGSGLYSTRVEYQESAFPMFVRGRAKQLLATIAAADESEDPIDIVHAFGAGCWPLAIQVARLTNAALVIEVWRPSLVTPAAALAQVTRFSIPPGIIVSEASISADLRKRAPRARIFSAPWGVHDSDEPPPKRGDRAPSIAMLFDSAESRNVASVLGGVAEVAKRVPDLLVFADASEPGRQSAIWSVARKLKLLDRLTLTPDMEARREPVLQADLLVLPEASGLQRTLVLEAMAVGIPVVALEDPNISTLIDGRTARLVTKPSPGTWAEAIGAALTDAGQADVLGRGEQEFVRSSRRASDQVSGVIRAYEQITQSLKAEAAAD